MWFNPQMNYCLARADFMRPLAGFRRSILEYRDYRELLPGLYLPMSIIQTAEKEDDQRQPTGMLTSRVTVHELRLNESIPDSQFVLEPRAGDYVIDTLKNQTYTYTPTSSRTLDVVSEKVGRQMASGMRANRVLAMSALMVGVFLGIVAYRLFRRQRSKRS